MNNKRKVRPAAAAATVETMAETAAKGVTKTAAKTAVKTVAFAAALAVMAGSFAFPVFAGDRGREAVRSTREEDSQTMNSVYLLPDSDTYYITEEDISWMDDEELMLARNEFYARRGRKFVTKSIRDYFNSQSWYEGRIDPDDFSTDSFNKYEQANVDFIVAYEKNRARKRHAKEERKTAGKKEHALLIAGYEGIRAQYEEALVQGWTADEYEECGLNRLISHVKAPSDLGYACRDLDDDGSMEFLIGPTNAKEYGEGAVFEIYTMKDGEPVRTASSSEHSRYYLCSDGSVRREREYGDGNRETGYYSFEDGGLVLRSLLLLDEEKGGEEPWFAASDIQQSMEQGQTETQSMRQGKSDSQSSTQQKSDSQSSTQQKTDSRSREQEKSDIQSSSSYAQGKGAPGPQESGLEDSDMEDGSKEEGGLEEGGMGESGKKAPHLEDQDMNDPEAEDSEGYGLSTYGGLESISYKEASEIRASHSAEELDLVPFEK